MAIKGNRAEPFLSAFPARVEAVKHVDSHIMRLSIFIHFRLRNQSGGGISREKRTQLVTHIFQNTIGSRISFE